MKRLSSILLLSVFGLSSGLSVRCSGRIANTTGSPILKPVLATFRSRSPLSSTAALPFSTNCTVPSKKLPCFARDGTCEGRFLLRTATEFIGKIALLFEHTDQFHCAAGPLLDLFLRESLNSRTVTGVVLHIHVREQDDVLEHVAKIPFFHRCVGNILVINQYPSLRWRPYSRDYLDQRSFSAP